MIQDRHIFSNALRFAVEKHHGQFDKGGHPYITHCLEVCHLTESDDEELLAIAILHDVVEDTDATYGELKEIGMTERVLEGVRCMTKVPGESYEEYKEKVKSNLDSRIVKKADLEHNTDIRRLKSLRDKERTEEQIKKDIARIARYHAFYVELKLLED